MNIPPMDSKSYRKNFTRFYRAHTEVVAFKSTTDAAVEVEASVDESGVKNVSKF